MAEIENVCVIGAGFMGQQIATVTVMSGYTVKAFDPSPDAPAKAMEELKKIFALQGNQEQEKRLNESIEKITYCKNLAEAVADADLVIEAVPEKLELKRDVFAQINKEASPHLIIASNSSSIPVVKLEDVVDQKEQVLNIHFDAPMIDRPMADIMPGTATSDDTMKRVVEWLESIGCVPVIVKKPIMGYLGNRLWRVVKRESLMLWAEGYGDVTEIDRAWMLQFGVELGPFAMMDAVGLDVVYDIEMAYYNESGDLKDKPPDALKEMIDRGELGLKSNRGFYDWSDPEFLKPDFLKKQK
jgi:3-hydroxybutyryl-CoA dehydrogenase